MYLEESRENKIPVITLQTNIIGTTHLLEAIKNSEFNPTIVSVLFLLAIFNKVFVCSGNSPGGFSRKRGI